MFSNVFSLDAEHGITNQPAIWMEADTTELFAWNNSVLNASTAFQVSCSAVVISHAVHLVKKNMLCPCLTSVVITGCIAGGPSFHRKQDPEQHTGDGFDGM